MMRPLHLDPGEREEWAAPWRAMQEAGQPVTVAYGGGVDSTAVLLGLHELGIRPGLILMADTGDERLQTYDFVNGPMRDWLASVGFPPVEWVRYQPKNYKHYPPYFSLSENCLTNSTLPSLAFGFKSCSLKWKVGPQDKYVAKWEPAVTAWAAGKRVVKLIGYDAGPKDIRRRNHAGDRNDAHYQYEYPLIEWGWDRDTCKTYIASRGLPVPPKSACYMCPATRPEELHDFPVELLQRIVIIETRAHDRLQGNWSKETWEEFNRARWEAWKDANVYRPGFDIWMTGEWDLIPAPGEPSHLPEWKARFPKPDTSAGKGKTTGLWRSDTKKRSGRITDYIRDKGLLPAGEVDRLVAATPRQALSAADIESWDSFIAGLVESSGCEGCSCTGA